MDTQLVLTVVFAALVLARIYMWYFRSRGRINPGPVNFRRKANITAATPLIPNPEQVRELITFRPAILDAILDELRNQGASPKLSNNVIRTGVGNIQVLVAPIEYQSHPDVVESTLEFNVTVGTKSTKTKITMQAAGLGATPLESFVTGARIWVKGVTPPIFAAERNDPNGWKLDATAVPSNEGEAQTWRAYPGPIQVVGTQQEATLLKQIVTDKLLLTLVLNDLGGNLIPGKINWLKVHIMVTDKNETTGECVLNGQHWTRGFNDLVDFIEQPMDDGKRWPVPSNSFNAIRQFIVIKQVESTV